MLELMNIIFVNKELFFKRLIEIHKANLKSTERDI